MKTIPDYFGSMVFDDRVMRERLAPEVYATLRRTIDENAKLDVSCANAVAEAMKVWALEHGATHFTHWFQPLTGITAEKHESFISPSGDGGVIMDFSGKELIKGESDASSFPSGGLRATFEARGYTTWDPTSYAFIKGTTLYIPTAFSAYSGEALDMKMPLLRSMEALNRQALRILRLFGNEDVKMVRTSVGAEQEYFLIDCGVYEKRRDLIYTGRTLFGAEPPKGQELSNHYEGSIKPRVEAFMRELDEELWKLGILAKTEHNEAAPAQHELAPVYTTTNIACDHNQIMMEMMKTVAKRHGMVCLLHEKPFKGVNGSGKHNNWSVSTDTGVNLLSPGSTPHENVQFLLFLTAVIQAVDDYQDLLRISVAKAGNDHRLGQMEAPPAIISIFLGDEITHVIEAIENDTPYSSEILHSMRPGGIRVLPKFRRDTTDRNRTSPFAFTGNKFEFRSVGSSDSVASPNIVLNSAVADTLRKFADRLEGAENFEHELHLLLRDTIRAHTRIIFNGNGYGEEWIREATEVRGLCRYNTTPDALPHMLDEKNIRMYESVGVYTENEVRSRCEIRLDNYCKTIAIEANTMIDMVRREILPAVETASLELARSTREKEMVGIPNDYEKKLSAKLSALLRTISDKTDLLEEGVRESSGISDVMEKSRVVRDKVFSEMLLLREDCDEAERYTPKKYWPFPTYGEILFSVQ